MNFYWCDNVAGSDLTGDGSQGNPWASIKHSVGQIGMLPTPTGNVLKVVNSGVPYSGVDNYNIAIGVAFSGTDYDTDPGLIIEGDPNTDWPILQLNVPSGNNGFEIQSGANYVSIRNLRVTVANASGQNPVPFYVSENAHHVRLECLDGGTLPNHEVIFINCVGTGSRTLQLEVRCCYCDLDTGEVSGNRRFIQYHQGTNLSVNHCVVNGTYYGVFMTPSGAPLGNVQIYNCDFLQCTESVYINNYSGSGAVQSYDNIFYNCTYAYYCPLSIAGTSLSSHHNCYYGLTQLCNHPTCATCDNVAIGPTDLWGVNPRFVGGPTWEWLYGLFLPMNYEPENSQVLWGSTTGQCIGACKPYQEEECLCTKPVPPPPCEPWGVVDCNYARFSRVYPADWQAAFAKPWVPSLMTVVCYDPGGENLQLTAYVKDHRPITQGRDIEFAEYRGRDTDIEFVDPTGLFDPRNPNSVIYEKAWYGKFVDVGAWIRGTGSVLQLQRYYLADARPTSNGTTVWRLNDIFAWLIRGEVRANSVGNFELSNGGTIDETKCSCDETVCRQQTWTITFTTATDFTIEGSLLGLDGAGSTGSDFNSNSGSVTILSMFWAGVWAVGDTVTFRTGVRYTARNVIQAAKDMLTNLADIPESQLELASWNDLEAKSTAYKITYWSYDVKDPLRLLRLFMRHRFATAYPTEEGQIAVMTFEPDPSQWVSRCIGKRLTLMELEPEHLEILNVLSAETGHGDEAHPTSGATYPATGIANESVARYQTEFPYTFTLRGYVSADYSVVYGLLQQLYVSRAGLPYNPRQLYRGTVKIQELNMIIGEVVYVDSVVPDRLSYALVVEYEKDIPGRKILLKLLDVTDFVEPPSGCGYAFCGGVGTTDDCWVYG